MIKSIKPLVEFYKSHCFRTSIIYFTAARPWKHGNFHQIQLMTWSTTSPRLSSNITRKHYSTGGWNVFFKNVASRGPKFVSNRMVPVPVFQAGSMQTASFIKITFPDYSKKKVWLCIPPRISIPLAADFKVFDAYTCRLIVSPNYANSRGANLQQRHVTWFVFHQRQRHKLKLDLLQRGHMII